MYLGQSFIMRRGLQSTPVTPLALDCGWGCGPLRRTAGSVCVAARANAGKNNGSTFSRGTARIVSLSTSSKAQKLFRNNYDLNVLIYDISGHGRKIEIFSTATPPPVLCWLLIPRASLGNSVVLIHGWKLLPRDYCHIYEGSCSKDPKRAAR